MSDGTSNRDRPEREGPPTLMSMRGIAPSLTGGVESTEYVRRLRAADEERARLTGHPGPYCKCELCEVVRAALSRSGESPREPSEEALGEAARVWRYSDEQSTEERMREALRAYLRAEALRSPVSAGTPQDDARSIRVAEGLRAPWRTELSDGAPQDGERLTLALRRAMKGYQRDIPCTCHDCRKDAGATDGVGTNGGCRHASLRTILAASLRSGGIPPEGGERRTKPTASEWEAGSVELYKTLGGGYGITRQHAKGLAFRVLTAALRGSVPGGSREEAPRELG